MDNSRKNVTVAISWTAYRRAKIWAAHHNITLSKLVSGFLQTVDLSKNARECVGYEGTKEELRRRLDQGE